MRLNRLLRTSSFRLTLLYVGLFGTSVLILTGVVYWAAADELAGQLDAELKAELTELRAEAQNQGRSTLSEVIARRLAMPSKRAFYYLLQGADGRVIAGNLPAGQSLVGGQMLNSPDRGDNSLQDEVDDDKLRALGIMLSDGRFLLVGRSTHYQQEITELFIRAFGWGFAATVLLALGSGFAMSRDLLRRVDGINMTAQQIMAGDLTQRLPIRGTADEFDRLADSLNMMFARIEMLMEGLRQVSNDIAHDLRTPLSRLRQRLESARRKATSLADYETAVDQALADTDTILDTFNALLRIAQIEAGSRRRGFSRVDLSEVFSNVAEVYLSVAQDLGQFLSSTIRPGIHLRGDRELLTQMLANLIENALRHTPTGTCVDIRLQEDREGPVAVIADRGPGIPAAARDKVFERFYRLDASRSIAGSGLGLSMVAAIAKLHGIIIELDDNQPGLRVVLRFRR